MTKLITIVLVLSDFFLIGLLTVRAQIHQPEPVKRTASSSAGVSLILQPYTGHSSGPEQSMGPVYLLPHVQTLLAELDITMDEEETVKLTPEEEKDYGLWHRVGLANGHLGDTVAGRLKRGNFVLGLLGNCNSLLGMLAGIQKSGPSRQPLKVGFIWIDAHGDFNTPETSLSGMLGGMPVAIAAGKCLFRLRLKAGLDPAIATRNIVMMGVRDLDPLEEELIDNSDIVRLPTEDIIQTSPSLIETLDRLSQRVDAIYVHIDLDVLDATAIPGANFLVPNGPSGPELGKALGLLLQNEKVKALGIASFPTRDEGRSKSLDSTLDTIKGGLEGWLSRQKR